MKKYFKTVTTLGLAFTMLFGTTAFAKDLGLETEAESNIEIEEVDPYIYEMIDAYENGTFVERNDSETFKPSEMFNEITPLSDVLEDIDYIYDLRKIDEETFEATQVALYSSLENELQDEKYGVKMFCSIVFKQQDFGDEWPYIMLTRVKGGVIEEADSYECIVLEMRYKVKGDAFDEDGNRYGWQSDSTSFSDYSIKNPVVGPAYSMPGPSDYYYNMGSICSSVGGFVEGEIEDNTGDYTFITIPNVIEAVK